MNTEPQNPEDRRPSSSDETTPLGGHDVPLTPPDAPAASGPSPVLSGHVAAETPPSSSGGGGARAGAIAIAVFGGIALLGAGGTAAFAAVHDVADSASSGTVGDVQSISVDGIDALDVDAQASNVTVRFGNVEDATLEVTGSRDNGWRLDRDGEELVVSNDRNAFGWFDDGWFGSWFDDEQTVVLTLPEQLNDGRLDADFSVSAGRLDVEGLFAEVDIDMGAGRLTMEGSASSIETEISAGRADLDLFDVDEADLSVSAGKLEATFANTAPSLITINVSAGSLDLTVPDETYNVSQDVSAGSLDNRLDHSSDSRHRIDATVSAGSVILRADD